MLSSLLRRRVIGRYPPDTSATHLGPPRCRALNALPLALESLEDRRLLAAIYGQKWHDVDADAFQDPGEPGLNGWTIELRDSEGGVIATTTTADRDLDGDGQIDPDTESGRYSFEDVADGPARTRRLGTRPARHGADEQEAEGDGQEPVRAIGQASGSRVGSGRGTGCRHVSRG